jgi:hypothetical protein
MSPCLWEMFSTAMLMCPPKLHVLESWWSSMPQCWEKAALSYEWVNAFTKRTFRMGLFLSSFVPWDDTMRKPSLHANDFFFFSVLGYWRLNVGSWIYYLSNFLLSHICSPFYLFIYLFFYSYVYTMFGTFLPPSPPYLHGPPFLPYPLVFSPF